MNLFRRDLYNLAGLGLIVGSFFAAAKAIGGLIALIYFVASTDFTELDPSLGDNIANTWKASQISGMVHGIGSFLILFLGGRWLLRGPKLLDRWIESDERTQNREESANIE
ncbi:hypothetical protein N9124_01325 [bacterium]|nr:hypothetical protein [Akkermansiaceae bacterium]MDB4588106.1 hypothetical protein [bacterium]MDB4369462.1 hypothetical protein [Akkermansiaceae bacterium]MDB4429706.1 hypothetical protein [Akkermansiaceae bacterium]MDB4451643.1 hypothetical protein [Akkermansiaceae bacterium]